MTPTVITAIVHNDYRYARTGAEVERLLDDIITTTSDWASLLYASDRPFADDSDVRPIRQLRVSVETGWGALNFVNEVKTDDTHGTWDSWNSKPPVHTPNIWFDPGTPTAFPTSAALPIALVRQAMSEFCRTGVRPECVRWQPARWY
ncbi:Imm1 family immunity protein [Saccharopolyspora flava]|uniref:Immunity protein Imm1 n=1 Tax=Saccharopolyspora flava TaxID=95161 RepID=A0A1I6U435_9PSEU|nr:Imm1 family immunity protein [Saccharopolyspora flava]SFS96037.1 Immunity protein Imm1 [Saccharopolyspora flava]